MVFFKRLLSSQTSILLKQNSEGLTNHNIKRKWIVPVAQKVLSESLTGKVFVFLIFLRKKARSFQMGLVTSPGSPLLPSLPQERRGCADLQGSPCSFFCIEDITSLRMFEDECLHRGVQLCLHSNNGKPQPWTPLLPHQHTSCGSLLPIFIFIEGLSLQEDCQNEFLPHQE